jgi:formylglycine-generating enzyme required for sulfatase activity|tara:strand:+ start:189 stop:455 length:267 start_codon:yes stop_codon:yes gene_type:complete
LDISPPSDYGLYDTADNVFEWRFEWYGVGYYAKSPEYDPTGPMSGTMRVTRGSSWNYPPNRMRVSRRIEKHPTSMLDYVEFRCVKVVP